MCDTDPCYNSVAVSVTYLKEARTILFRRHGSKPRTRFKCLSHMSSNCCHCSTHPCVSDAIWRCYPYFGRDVYV